MDLVTLGSTGEPDGAVLQTAAEASRLDGSDILAEFVAVSLRIAVRHAHILAGYLAYRENGVGQSGEDED